MACGVAGAVGHIIYCDRETEDPTMVALLASHIQHPNIIDQTDYSWAISYCSIGMERNLEIFNFVNILVRVRARFWQSLESA